ncbi:MAG: DUF58 domain-containing protein [Peptococcaceae bacterium]|nr:DUF58 domain-containing protein [Peptococcaceae bacterium]
MITKSYIVKIRANISIYASQRTANIMDGKYKSIFKGKELDFEDLREYVVGDDIKDIDWKSSARSGSVLVKRCSAEKKHNIMFVLDTGKKMTAHTKAAQSKAETALMSMGTIAYLAQSNGDYVGAIYSKDNSYVMCPLKCGLNNLETILYNYERDIATGSLSIESILDHIGKTQKRKMILFVITDLAGMACVEEYTLKKLSHIHDVLFVNISDMDMTGPNLPNMPGTKPAADAYDWDHGCYIPGLIANDCQLQRLEQQIKTKIHTACIEKLKRHRISATTIDKVQEIPHKTIELLERHKYANVR